MQIPLHKVSGAIDFDAHYVRTNGSVIAYDYLVLAIGGEANFFGLKEVEENSFQLKSIGTATGTRNHLLSMFEQASRAVDPDKRKALLTFVVVGGGPVTADFAVEAGADGWASNAVAASILCEHLIAGGQRPPLPKTLIEE